MPAPQQIELVVCDIAGTTVHDDGQVSAAFTATLAEAGVQVSPDELRAVRGAAKRDAIRMLLPHGTDLAARVERTYLQFCEQLSQRFRVDGVRPMQGAEDLFA